MPKKGRVRIAIVHACPCMRIGLEKMLEAIGGYVIHLCAKNGAEYRQACKGQPVPDLAIVDLDMPERDGYLTLAYMHEQQPGLLALAITYDGSDAVLQRAYRVHARAVLPRTVAQDELCAALRDVLSGGFHFNSNAQRRLAASAAPFPTKEPKGAKEIATKLSPREEELLKWMCHPDMLEYADIAERMGLKPSSVETLRKRIKKKTGAASREAMILFAKANNLDR